MKGSEHTALIQEIATSLGDATKVTALLAKLSSDYTDTLNRIETLVPFEADNESLRKANMQLFTQIGSQDKAIETEGKETKPNETDNKDKKDELTFDNLINEKGGLI